MVVGGLRSRGVCVNCRYLRLLQASAARKEKLSWGLLLLVLKPRGFKFTRALLYPSSFAPDMMNSFKPNASSTLRFLQFIAHSRHLSTLSPLTPTRSSFLISNNPFSPRPSSLISHPLFSATTIRYLRTGRDPNIR